MDAGKAAGLHGKEVTPMYTDYGYMLNGIEYATVDEALDAQSDEDE